MVKRPLFINGRFLGKKITGTERFAGEIVTALDALLKERNSSLQATIIAPRATPRPPNLSHIGFTEAGTLKGHPWEQWDLYRASRSGFLLNLCNSGPVLHPRQMVVIHDAAVYRVPGNYSLGYGTFHRSLGHILARRAKLASVSEFSRTELIGILGKRVASLPVFPNGHEHINRHQPDSSVLDKLKINGKPFFLFVGSPVPSKNLSRAIEAFTNLNNPDVSFVIVGAAQSKVFGSNNLNIPANVIMPGRLTDGEIVALYQNATALVFPSLYEGFGIPPLEAIALGCPVLASNIPPLREVCGSAALYFNPRDINNITEVMAASLAGAKLKDVSRKAAEERLAVYSWKNSAGKMLDWLEKNEGL